MAHSKFGLSRSTQRSGAFLGERDMSDTTRQRLLRASAKQIESHPNAKIRGNSSRFRNTSCPSRSVIPPPQHRKHEHSVKQSAKIALLKGTLKQVEYPLTGSFATIQHTIKNPLVWLRGLHIPHYPDRLLYRGKKANTRSSQSQSARGSLRSTRTAPTIESKATLPPQSTIGSTDSLPDSGTEKGDNGNPTYYRSR
jgi:hypothetical protein